MFVLISKSLFLQKLFLLRGKHRGPDLLIEFSWTEQIVRSKGRRRQQALVPRTKELARVPWSVPPVLELRT